MKKILFLLIILLLSGCSVNYDLEISENGFSENISGEISKDEFDMPSQENADLLIYDLLYLDQSVIINSDEIYNRTIEDSNNIVKFNYNYKFINNFKDSQIINNCFEKHLIEETDNMYIIKLGGNFYCQYADQIHVKVTTDNYVIENNADKVEDDNYYWTLSEGSKNNNTITLVVSKDVKKSNLNSEGNINYFQVIGITLFLILVLVIFVLYKKHKNSEK